MIVRWKPLLILSGLFAVIAVVGVVAMAYALVPRGSADILPTARADRAARHYEKALIHYKRALQLDPKNAAIHEEMAAMYGEWLKVAPDAKKTEIRNGRFAALAEATKFGKSLKEPRRQLLAAAMAQDEVPESLHWAKDLLTLEPENADALYVLASEALEDRNPTGLPDIERKLAVLKKVKAAPVRVAWLEARLAQERGDASAREAVLTTARAIKLPAEADPVDRTAAVRLRALDVETTQDADRLAERVQALKDETQALGSAGEVAPNRIMRLSVLLERVQKSLTSTAAKAEPALKAACLKQVEAIDQNVEAIFQDSLAAASKSDLHIYLTYADHLRYRAKYDRCLEVVAQALKSPLAKLPTSNEVVMGLHAVAVESALANTDDDNRFTKADPHIKELIASSLTRFQGLGHLFIGAIELEKSGVGGTPSDAKNPTEPARPVVVEPKLRASALNHLKIAATQLPDVVEAQARYGVALILSQEQALGRQYLQKAMQLGDTEPQYQVWAAWSMVQAGYPEEAEPIVNHLLAEMAQNRMPRELEGSLHLLNGEIHQVRRSPGDMKKALAEYEQSYGGGKTAPAAVDLRMAQIDLQLGNADAALQRINRVRAGGQGGTAAEHLAVLTLLDMNKKDDAYKLLAEGRKKFPDSDDLAGLEAAMLIKDGKPREADQTLVDFLARHPDNASVILSRAQLLSEHLDDVTEARRLLINLADRSENSAPLVQLALLDLKLKDHAAAAQTVAKIRARWKEAAVADLLDAQLSIEKGNNAEALRFFDEALKKDPGNKMVHFWKAQIERSMGASGEAMRTFEALAQGGSTKKLDSGVALAAAAQSALANMALQSGNVDDAIRRFEGLRTTGGLGQLEREDRWQLVRAYAANNQWSQARREIAALLNDPKSPPSKEERVRAANFYRVNKEDGPAVAQLDYVLKLDPSHTEAVVTRAYMLTDAKKSDEAMALLRRGIAASGDKKPPGVFYEMLAALEFAKPPKDDAATRALTILDQGLAVEPESLDLVKTKYRLLLISRGPKDAVAYVESAAADDPNGMRTRLLADVYREQAEFAKAEKTLTELVGKNPKDVSLASALVYVVGLEAGRASDLNERDKERGLNDKAESLIREFRSRFPGEIVFLQEDCELALRRGDINRATTITQEIDKLAKNSPVGPFLRAQLYEVQGRLSDAAEAYAEALRRNPSQADTRLRLGQARLRLGDTEAALAQAKLVLENDPNRVDALLLEARALGQSTTGSPSQIAARHKEAVALLEKAIETQPKVTALYHQIAEIQIADNQPDAAIATLKRGVGVVPEDAIGLASIVELLARPAGPNGKPLAENLKQAQALAASVGQRDTEGNLTLAMAIAFHKAEQLELARQWAEKATTRLDTPLVHLNYGDILLSLAERSSDSTQSKTFLDNALSEYDKVLSTHANSIEAVNNKAWILHSYMGQSKEALTLAQGLLGRVDPSTLPGEFFDTLGAIQESLGKKSDAEDSYTKGLRKTPDHPVLNLHMGKLLMADSRRASKARGYLEKAFAARNRMSPTMASEVATLMEKVRGN